jgi:hypothetical protein
LKRLERLERLEGLKRKQSGGARLKKAVVGNG